MTEHVAVYKKLSPGVAVIDYGGDRALWTRAASRQVTECAACGGAIGVGDVVWRVVGNQQYRAARIHNLCVGGDVAKREKKR